MFGSIAVVRPKEGKEAEVIALFEEWWRLRSPQVVPDAIAGHVFRLVERPDELMVPVVFETREGYEANANDPAQSYWHRRLVALLKEEPRWIDGDVVSSWIRGSKAKA
jgi:hypothetical protein